MCKIYFIEKSGKKRNGEYHNCEYCDDKFIRVIRNYKPRQRFCSLKCKGYGSKKRITLECCWCKKEFERRSCDMSKYNFCSRRCKEIAQSLDGGFIEIQPKQYGSNAPYRIRAFRFYPHKCEVCGYNKHIELLQVHHVDNNRDNNEIENLAILCPTCHWSITLKKAIFSENREYKFVGL